jgi:probable rRNA maturation factor
VTEPRAVVERDAAIEVCSTWAAWANSCPGVEKLARAVARLALAKGSAEAAATLPGRTELAIILGDDAQQRRLNRDWRGIDRSTNVLAFPAWESGSPVPADAPLLLGDVMLAFETVAREAQEQGKSLADHLAHLIVHGVLHLLGYDHATDAEAAIMETLETSILASLGVADPYRGTM